ncbi:MAG: hypothetical protein QM523_04140 [Candidatus Pacebacteria bacterium]|nr:hypothetical protein [Candidatus Paceibacterota bacterium]
MFEINQGQREGLASISDSLASLSIASLALYLSGYLKIPVSDAIGLALAIFGSLIFGFILRGTRP